MHVGAVHIDNWNTALLGLERVRSEAGDLAALTHVVSMLRPSGEADAESRVASLCEYLELEANHSVGLLLGRCIRDMLGPADCGLALTDSGIPSDRSFLGEFLTRLGGRFLPEVERENDLRTMIRCVFHEETDYLWLRTVSDSTWKRLLTLMGIAAESVPGVARELASSIRVLAHQVTSLGVHPDLTERLDDLDDLDSPFLALGLHVLEYLSSYENEIVGDEQPNLDRVLTTVAACRRMVLEYRAQKHRFGTSLRTTNLTNRLLRKLDRLGALLHLSEPTERNFQISVAKVLQSLVEAENTRNHLVPHIRGSADRVVLQVVERAAKKGEHYITATWREYGRFLVASMWGGLIVAIFALLKIILSKLEVPLAVEALLFGVNYSVCFVLIYLTGSALATKQPAMTANTIARSLDEESGGRELDAVAELIVRASRSQFISFFGNLVCALPAALLAAYIYELIVGVPPIDVEKAGKLLISLHPWYSGSIFYAGIAGVFLFSGGLISGYVDNRCLYRQVPARVAQHPFLLKWLGSSRAERFAAFLDRNLGVMTGNVFLGFCLGSAGTIGVILGLPLDIRHIAFGAAHFGMAVEALRGVVALPTVFETMMGVGLIGFVNFLVSFGLALAAAFEARQVSFSESRALFRLLLRRLVTRPWHFVIPPFQSSDTAVSGN